MVEDAEPHRYVCPRCHRSALFFWRPAAEPTCRRHGWWRLTAIPMVRA